jgi:hypothetical protein
MRFGSIKFKTERIVYLQRRPRQLFKTLKGVTNEHDSTSTSKYLELFFFFSRLSSHEHVPKILVKSLGYKKKEKGVKQWDKNAADA